MLSVIIPSRNEQFLNKTVDDLLAKAEGEIEIIVVLEGYWPEPALNPDPRVVIIHHGQPQGMRQAINAAAAIARGEYLMKIDAHCMVDEGFDIKLKADCEDNWVVIPRRKRLDPENWTFAETHKPDIDYMYLSAPNNPKDFGGAGLHGRVWDERNSDEALKSVPIVDCMSFQGSCWFMKRNYFYELELMDAENYGIFAQEAQEIGLKSWLSGGKVVVNKNTWYAHLHKGSKYGRGYFLDIRQLKLGNDYTNKWTTGTAWHKQTKPLSWLIKRFSPVPSWDEVEMEKLRKRENAGR